MPVSRLDLIRLSRKLPFAPGPSYILSTMSRGAFAIDALREFELPAASAVPDTPTPSRSRCTIVAFRCCSCSPRILCEAKYCSGRIGTFGAPPMKGEGMKGVGFQKLKGPNGR